MVNPPRVEKNKISASHEQQRGLLINYDQLPKMQSEPQVDPKRHHQSEYQESEGALENDKKSSNKSKASSSVFGPENDVMVSKSSSDDEEFLTLQGNQNDQVSQEEQKRMGEPAIERADQDRNRMQRIKSAMKNEGQASWQM